MKYQIEIEDLDKTLSALSQAIASYSQISSACYFGCEIPKAYTELFNKLGIEDLESRSNYLLLRLNILKDIYYQLEEIEQKGKENERLQG